LLPPWSIEITEGAYAYTRKTYGKNFLERTEREAETSWNATGEPLRREVKNRGGRKWKGLFRGGAHPRVFKKTSYEKISRERTTPVRRKSPPKFLTDSWSTPG